MAKCLYKSYAKYESDDCTNFTKTDEVIYTENLGEVSDKEYRWIEIADDSEYICIDQSKYRKCYLESSEDGSSWEYVVPTVYKIGAKISDNSTDCGYGRPIYMWRVIDSDKSIVEIGKNKFRYEYLHLSNDEGRTWANLGSKRIGPVSCVYDNSTISTLPYNYLTSYTTGSPPFHSTVEGDDIVLYIPSNVVSGLTDLTLNEGVKIVSIGSTSKANKITSVTLPSSLLRVGYSNSFAWPTLENVTIKEGLTYISDSMFKNCEKLTNIEIPKTVDIIQSSAFQSCTSLNSVKLYDGLKVLKSQAFYDCRKLNSISIPSTVEEIGFKCFDGCSGLTSVTLPEKLQMLEAYAFQNTRISDLVVGDNTWYVGSAVIFPDSRYVKSFSLTLGKGVRYFGGIETGPDQDVTLTFKGKVPPFVGNSYKNTITSREGKLTIRVPSQSVELYKKAFEGFIYYNNGREKFDAKDCVVGY